MKFPGKIAMEHKDNEQEKASSFKAFIAFPSQIFPLKIVNESLNKNTEVSLPFVSHF